MKKILIAYSVVFFVSCKQENYKFAIFEYKVSDTNYSIKIDDPKKLKIIQKGISSLKQEAIIFPIIYDLQIGLQNGDTLKYWCNGSIMMDSAKRFYMPKGKVQKDFIELLKSTAPRMKIDEDPGG
jgi:hypothetical protein